MTIDHVVQGTGPERVLVMLGGFLLTGLASALRVTEAKHFPTVVMAGSAVGVCRRKRSSRRERAVTATTVAPMLATRTPSSPASARRCKTGSAAPGMGSRL